MRIQLALCHLNHMGHVSCSTTGLQGPFQHYCDVIMGAMAFQITSLTTVYSPVYSGADQIRYQSSASLAFVRGIHRWPVNSSHKWPVTRNFFHLMTSPWRPIFVVCGFPLEIKRISTGSIGSGSTKRLNKLKCSSKDENITNEYPGANIYQ